MSSATPLTAISMLTLLCLLITLGSCWKVNLYRDTRNRGGHIEMEGNGCQRIPRDFNDKTSSVNTFGGCVRLYEHRDCRGRVLELFPGSGTHSNLKKHNFNDKASSVGNCP
uniref:Beta/gamma crystallin 'Greek key' domain-containing protein n=1 Tax=Cacopsylla melanoneura TaxID=428564 RepID=A0A8D8RJI9_9HEMI